MGMNRTPRAALALALGLFAACRGAPPPADLAANEDLYRETAFATRLPGDRTVFVAPVADARRADVMPAAEGGYPIAYDSDARWDRPVAAMVDDLLRRELEQSGLFAAQVTMAAAADVLLEPSLVGFSSAAMELESGGCAIGELAVRLRAFGPTGADGQRPLLLDQIYGERQVTRAGMRTMNRHLLMGRVAQAAMLRLLHGIDGANLGRSGMPVAPLQVVEPAPGAPLPAPPAAPPADRG